MLLERPRISFMAQMDGTEESLLSVVTSSQSWNSILELIGAHIAEYDVGLVLNIKHNEYPLVCFLGGIGDDYIGRYLSNYIHENPWAVGKHAIPEGQIYEFSRLVQVEELQRGRFYAEWLQPQGFGALGCGVVLSQSRELAVQLDILVKDQATLQRAKSTLEAFAARLQRAVALARQLQTEEHKATFYREALERRPEPTLTLDRNLVCEVVNKSARRLLQWQDGVFVSTDGVLRFAHSSDLLALKEALTIAKETDRRPIIGLHGSSRAPLFASIEHLKAPFLAQAPLVASRDCYMLTFHCTNRAATFDLAEVQRVFQLTPAEASLADALFHGESVSEYAAARGVATNTVRNQLRSLMKKTETNRQVDLIHLLALFAR